MHICQLCKKAPASIHLTDIHDNVKKEMHICESCAREKGFNLKSAGALAHILELAAKKGAGLAAPAPAPPPRPEAEEDLACPRCGVSWSQFHERGRLGCPNDYLAFADRLRRLVAGQLPPRARPDGPFHVGKRPGTAAPDSGADGFQALRLRIRRAVAEENYEAAAALKAELDSLETGAAGRGEA